MKIYTKGGDNGDTSLLGGRRVSKGCIEIEVVGEIDELNAVLGMALIELKKFREISNALKEIQRDLFRIGSEIASLQTPIEDRIKKIKAEEIDGFEKLIDRLSSDLPDLQNFILPGGSKAGAQIHLARAICRRAERALVKLNKPVRPELFQYLNRLGDLFFTIARWTNYQEGITEERA